LVLHVTAPIMKRLVRRSRAKPRPKPSKRGRRASQSRKRARPPSSSTAARAELFRLLDSAFNSASTEALAPFEELRGRHILALAIVGKFLRTTGAPKDIADQFYTLSAALNDLQRGIVHPMLMPKKPTGRRADRSDIWRVRVTAGCGVECLMRGSLSRHEAAKRAAKQFPALKNVLRTGTTLKTALLRWRDAVMRGPLKDVVARGAAHEFRDFLKRVGHQLTREQFTASGEAYLKSASDRAATRLYASPPTPANPS
jgi:hypothetical protein